MANSEQNAVRLPCGAVQAASLDLRRSPEVHASVGSLERASSNKNAQRTDKRFVFLFACITNLGSAPELTVYTSAQESCT